MRELQPGQRVRLTSKPTGLELQCDRGEVICPDLWANHYIIRLDEPAIERHYYGGNKYLRKIRVDVDNLEIIDN